MLEGGVVNILGGRRALALAGIAAAASVALVAPAITPTEASWVDNEWTHSTLGTSSFDCGTDEGYKTTATGTFLSGGVLGVDLDSVADLEGVSATRTGAASPVHSPAGATHVTGGSHRDTYLKALDVTALGSIGIDLSGYTVGLPIGSAGAVNQFSQVTDLGYSAAASGLVANDGGLGVTPSTPHDELPESARIDLATLLPAVTGVSDVALDIGAVGATSSLDWCTARESTTWGDGSDSGANRDYGVAGLDLDIDSPLVAGLVPRVQTAVTAVSAAIASLEGGTGGIAQAISGTLTGVGGVLQGLALGSNSGTVSLTGLDLGAVNALISGPGAVLSDGVVTLDVTDPNGTITVDLAELVGGPNQLNNLAPNTELVINAPVINDILTRVGTLVQGWVDDVTDALLAAISAIQLHVDLTTTAGITSLGINIISVKTTLDTDLGSLIAPSGTPPVVTLDATALDLGLLGSVVAGILSGLGLGSLSSIVSGIDTSLTLPGDVLAAITSAITTNLTSIVNTLVTDLTAIATQLVTALGDSLTSLPGVLSVMVNVQPDLPGAPSDVGFTSASPPNLSQEYLVTGLRIGLLDAVSGANVFVNLATASAGPNAFLP